MTVTPITQRQFPADPAEDDLREVYTALRRAAQTLSRSRGQFIRQVRERDLQIERMQAEIASYANNAQLDLSERAHLLGIVSKYRDIFAAMETAGDELVGGLTDYTTGSGPFYGGRPLGRLLAAVRAFVVTWQQLKEANTSDPTLPGA